MDTGRKSGSDIHEKIPLPAQGKGIFQFRLKTVRFAIRSQPAQTEGGGANIGGEMQKAAIEPGSDIHEKITLPAQGKGIFECVSENRPLHDQIAADPDRRTAGRTSAGEMQKASIEPGPVPDRNGQPNISREDAYKRDTTMACPGR